MVITVSNNEVFALVRPSVDAHTLGISAVGELLKQSGFGVKIADAKIAGAVALIAEPKNQRAFLEWLERSHASRLGFSYRLDPSDAVANFGRVYTLLRQRGYLHGQGGRIRQAYFSGLPAACEAIQREYKGAVPTFVGDETQAETLRKIGVPESKIPPSILRESEYDERRLKIAERVVDKESYRQVKPRGWPGYEELGTFQDTLVKRINANRRSKTCRPLMRAHVGPYNPNHDEAIKEFTGWLQELSRTGLLDIVSIGSSQLSQSDFGKDWQGKPNGGGVPINSEADLRLIWEASRPMLVRTYAGTRDIPRLAQIYERTINIAWHALSFWWFNRIDGRGPYSVKENLRQHLETLKIIAQTGKPFEPNIPHHFAFRGADDCTYALSAYLAAKTARELGVKYLVLQVMLNTPKYTWGVQDLAKARALLRLVRELEGPNFKVFLQPRAGLDYFSPNLEKARAQLAAVSMMMDDIEPNNNHSPDIIHVVSYCEGVKLASPEYINESIQITAQAIEEYRELKARRQCDDMAADKDAAERTERLYRQVKNVAALIEKNIINLYSPAGLYQVFKLGILTAPYLWEDRAEFSQAVKWNTGLVNGGVEVVNEEGNPLDPTERVRQIFLEATMSGLRAKTKGD